MISFIMAAFPLAVPTGPAYPSKMDNDDRHKDFPPDEQQRLPLFEGLNNYVLLLFSFACFLMYVSMSLILFDMELFTLSLALPALLGIVIPLYVLSGRFGLGFIRDFPFPAPGLVETLAVAVISVAAIRPVDTIVWFFEKTSPVNEDYINFLISIKPKGLLELIALGLGTVLISPLGEELIFRGVVQRVFQRNMGGTLAVALAGLVFACAHFDLAVIPAITMMGIMMGYLLYRTGSLFYPFLSHAIFNLASLLRLNSASEEAIRSGDRSAPSPVWVAGSLIVLAAALALFEIRQRQKKRDAAGENGASP